ncbi:hypothetical protein CAEBREN_05300 [Caenorhabditis brenneri]|uniref:NR LBD domain-containing protein n=1 Tax=Caenorhabditis brenneri TaxID=135651 RepID=G0NEN2_CAEBE|nr:hypothetical protein CAEBREN_05300 [Caenorhabditis brenneri]
MRLGSETPIFAKNTLNKLAIGLKIVREKASMNTGQMEVVRKIGKKEAMGFIEKDFLAVARWLTYFDDFQRLPQRMQMLLLKSIWHVWIRLDKLSLTAASRQNKKCHQNEMLLGNNSAFDTKSVEMDITWMTKYPKEKLKFFFDEPHDWVDAGAITPLIQLQPSDIELTYMLCQLCLQYAGKRHQGEILQVTEKFQEVLANDLHDYYTNELKMARYSGRLNQMLKINNMIQQDIREKRVKNELAKVFPIYCVEFSHPEMFEDLS